MFLLFVVISFFVLAFSGDKVQLWEISKSTLPAKPYGPLQVFFLRMSAGKFDRFLVFNFFWLVAHIVVIGLVFEYLKIGGSGVGPAGILSFALGIFYARFYLSRKKK
jgi:hypothetical protein